MPLRRGQSKFFVSIKENSDSVNGRTVLYAVERANCFALLVCMIICTYLYTLIQLVGLRYTSRLCKKRKINRQEMLPIV